MAITKCLMWVPPVNQFTVAARALRQCGRSSDHRWLEWRKTMSKTNELSDAEPEVVIGENGTPVVGLSVGNQTAIALNQELKAAYLAHQFGWSPQWGSSAP